MVKKKLTRKAIKHGELQVRKMVQDRPSMQKYLTENDFIWKWVVTKFAGEDLTETIDWDSRTPYHGAKAAHLYPCKTERGCINLKKGLSFEASWAGVIFELHNIAYSYEFKQVIKNASNGHLKKKEFILKMARIEFKAIKGAEKFYKEIWEPWARRKGFQPIPQEWNCGCPSKFDDWIKCFGQNSDYPWKVYSDFYEDHLEDWVVADDLAPHTG